MKKAKKEIVIDPRIIIILIIIILTIIYIKIKWF